MTNNNYLLPGIAAIVLALLFPLYWISFIGAGIDDIELALREDLSGLDWSDLFMLVIGALEIYIYLNLIESLKNHLNSIASRTLLFVMLGAIVLFHLTLLIDLFMSITGSESILSSESKIVDFAIIMSIASIVIHTIAGLALSILLILKGKELNRLLLIFSIIFLIVNILQMTGSLIAANLVMFPVSLVVLAVYFVTEPDNLEVV